MQRGAGVIQKEVGLFQLALLGTIKQYSFEEDAKNCRIGSDAGKQLIELPGVLPIELVSKDAKQVAGANHMLG